MTVIDINRLPEEVRRSIPSGEEIHWYGRPDWKSLGYCCYGIKYLIIYLLLSVLYTFVKMPVEFSLAAFVNHYIPYMLSGTVAGIILFILAFASAKHTCYVITDKRIVIRTGIALVFLLNLPFKNILSIDRQRLKNTRGNLAFTIQSKKRIPYFSCWPSVRGGSVLNPVPAFRSILDVQEIERLVGIMAEKNQKGKDYRESQERQIQALNSRVPA